MFILDSNSYARDKPGVESGISKMVEDSDGEMLVSRWWNEQKLAYPIKGRRKGTYWLSYFRMDSERVADFNRACRLNDSILRNLTLKVEPRIVDALVAHARPASEQEEKPPVTTKTDETKVAEEEIPADAAVEAMEGSTPEEKEGEKADLA
jgi:small subunit ribosomal protein S6